MEQLGAEEDDAIAYRSGTGRTLLPGCFTKLFSQIGMISAFQSSKRGAGKISKVNPKRMLGIMAASSVYYCLHGGFNLWTPPPVDSISWHLLLVPSGAAHVSFA